VRTKNSFWFVGTRLALALAATLLTVAPLRAADWAYRPFDRPTPTYTADFGMRFWYGKTTTAKNLYDTTGTELLSRLTYGDLSIFAAEVYGRFDLDKRWFIKGYIGGGTFRNGSLKDEDFGLPPPLQPYSSTLSVQQDSTPIYGSLDAGFNVVWGPDFRVGLFAGLHYMNQNISAYGCTQTSFNPFICGAFPIPNQVKVITQDNNWYSVRLGVDATFEFDRFRLSLDAAVVPYTWLYGADTHWLRVGNQPGDFSGPIPEDGKGWGYQLDAFLSYRVYESLSVGVGARYWYMQSRGFTHFENHVIGFTAFPQAVEWKTQNFGVFLQASLKLGPYAVLDVH
jgi:Autotransporter beta-domain